MTHSTTSPCRLLRSPAHKQVWALRKTPFFSKLTTPHPRGPSWEMESPCNEVQAMMGGKCHLKSSNFPIRSASQE